MQILLIVLADLLWWWYADARIKRLPGARLWRIVLTCFVSGEVFYAMSYLLMSLWARSQHNPVPLPLHVSAYIWHLLVLPVVLMVIGTEMAVRVLVRLIRVRRINGTAPATPKISQTAPSDGLDSSPTSGVTRRQLMSAVAAVVPPLVTAGVTGVALFQVNRFRIRNLDIKIPGLPMDLHGVTIAQVTDIHIGKLCGAGMERKIAAAVNALGADLIVFSGDLIDFSLEDLPQGIDFIRRLKPRHGPDFLAMIEGNHDLMDDADAFEEMAQAASLPILIDEARLIRVPGRQTPIQLLGLCWGQPGSTERDLRMRMEDFTIAASMQRVLPLRDPRAFPLLLTHHPHAFDPAAEAGLPLTLAGHTHGGQLMLTDQIGAGPLRFRYWTGVYQKGNSQMFVNNGVGNWFPLRWNAPAEIVKLTLLRA